MEGIRLAAIPSEHYADYRYKVIFDAYKWDPQVEDSNTIARHALLLSRETADELERQVERLAWETVQMEEALMHRLPFAKQLGLPRQIRHALERLHGYEASRHVRLMRFDFHPTPGGWAISEVNSDVPGGLAEASVLPGVAARYFPGYESRHDIADGLIDGFRERIGEAGTLALVHATSYSDDRQVMEFLGDRFQARGYQTVMAAPDHIAWQGKQAYSIVEGEEGKLDGILRFYPLEWLANLPRRSGWKGFYDGETPACNHPIAMLTQSKRLPLIWDELGVDLTAWKQALPETRDPREIKRLGEDWIYKPALGRVGEGILIREAVTAKESKKIERSAHWQAGKWIAQRRFASQPLNGGEQGEYHLCIGVFTVNGKCAGFYGRISPYARIDHKAIDIPVLVEKEGKSHAG
ncbi:glutathionylspermidine synthase family protein [Paenibacillus daejeonensis]|uniref:glutathionylspermidine synthase family protein n=1 Tax=Paenibacillus daejeonensis TaxID=135193 RepID=UPI000376BC59|nr:glutathionylspermidine synthase family protein [Paenibacillus daejeonensis]